MAKVRYNEILEAIAARLEENFMGKRVLIEEELFFSNDDQPIIGLYLERRDPSDDQFVRRRVDYNLIITVWCWVFSMEGPRTSAMMRNDLIADVEEFLLGDRTHGLDAMIETSWIEGGEMPTGRVPDTSGFASGGEIRLIVKVNATSTEG